MSTLFAQSLFHEEPHHHHDQSTTFSLTLQYARPKVSYDGSGERNLQLYYRALPVRLLHLVSSLSTSSCDVLSVNDAHHLRERRRVFDIPGLFKITAQAMSCETEQIVDFRKLGEGGLNRIFPITLDTGFQLAARIPYPLLVPGGSPFLRSTRIPLRQTTRPRRNTF